MRSIIMRKVLLSSSPVIFFLTIVFSLVIAVPSWATQREVGPGQTYATIQGAINAASAGDTVNVHNDTYNENVNINKANLYLVANTQLGPIISPTATGDAIDVSAANVTIDGFKITGWHPASTEETDGIRSSTHDGLSVINCEIYAGPGKPSSGIYVRNSTQILISGNTVYNATKGVNVISGHSTDGSYANGVTISNNTIHDNDTDGIDIHGQYITISGNNIYDNMATNWASTHPDGIQFIAGSADGYTTVQHARVYNNVIRNHTQNIYTQGTGTDESSDCTDIHIFNNVLYMDSGTVNGVDMDTLSASNINIDSSKDVYIYNNTIGRAGNNAIYIHNNANGTINIENNIIANSLQNGIYAPDPNDLGTLNYNIYYNPSGTDVILKTDYYTLAQLQAATAHEDNGVAEDPLLNAFPTPTLQAGSPAINTGLDLGTPYAIDKIGHFRGVITWDLGAYEFDTVGPGPPYQEIPSFDGS